MVTHNPTLEASRAEIGGARAVGRAPWDGQAEHRLGGPRARRVRVGPGPLGESNTTSTRERAQRERRGVRTHRNGSCVRLTQHGRDI